MTRRMQAKVLVTLLQNARTSEGKSSPESAAGKDEYQTNQRTLTYFFKGPSSASFCLFLVFYQTNITNFTTNQCEKCPSSRWCCDSNSRPAESPPITTRPGLTYFVMGSITVRLTSYLTGLDSAVLQMFKSTTYLLIWPNPNQSNRRSAIQPYPKEVSIVWTCSWCYKTFLEEIWII